MEGTENNLTKLQALEALNQGKKISHVYFTDDEYVYLKDGSLTDEQGIELTENIDRFFDARPWNDGWYIKETN